MRAVSTSALKQFGSILIGNKPVLSLDLVLVLSCKEARFNSVDGKSGRFHSPNFPEPYPALSHCHYFFQGSPDERIRITFDVFDLEPGTDAG